jgi:hypothetical protein
MERMVLQGMNEAQQLVNILFPFDQFAPHEIPFIALHILQGTPTLQRASDAEAQRVFDLLCTALSDLQLARIAAKSARFVQ